ncbi:MAG: tryptophan--tRNA ligase [bacterium]|nr:tryptophan--tRNA ligase [bacterium]
MKKRIFSGAQPTGRLHIGNYLGALKNWTQLQSDYDCVFGIVDYHAITVPFSPQEIKEKVFDCAVGFLASGINPGKSIIMLQSLVPQHTELTWIFNCISPIQDLMRVPTFKEKASRQKGNVNMGLLDYPVLMAVDILIYKAEFVPVGDDQIPHIELTREIAREFNKRFGETFPEPKEIVRPRMLGLDGTNKMSKTLGNCIYLDESPDEIWKKLAPAVTDTRRKKRQDPGEPNDCNIFKSYHKAFSNREELTYVEKGCRNASIGCLDCKRILFDNIVKELTPLRENIERFKDKKDYVMDVIIEGSKKAGVLAERTLREVKQKIGFDYLS